MIKSFFEKIYKKLWVYLILCVSASLLTSYIVGLINQPRDEETITIFVASHGVNIDNLKTEVEKNRPDYLREIVYKSYSVDDPDYEMYYASYMFGFSDVVIIPQSQIGNETILEYYAEITNEVKENYFPNNETYLIDDKNYGILIHKKDDDTYLNNDYINYKSLDNVDENYYMFFDVDSLHVGDLNGSSFDTALQLMQVFRK